MIYVILNDVMCQLLTIIIKLKSKKKFFLTEYLAFLRPASKKTLPWLNYTFCVEIQIRGCARIKVAIKKLHPGTWYFQRELLLVIMNKVKALNFEQMQFKQHPMHCTFET